MEDASLPNGSVDLDNDLVDIFRRTRIDHTREYIPNVIEPSFGIGRILYSVLEHVYWHRAGDVARGVSSNFFCCSISSRSAGTVIATSRSANEGLNRTTFIAR